MSHAHGKQLVSRDLKYPIFILGLFLMIGGGLAVQRLGLPLDVEVATVAVGFILFFIGIVIE
jgi:hypothetical protein